MNRFFCCNGVAGVMTRSMTGSSVMAAALFVTAFTMSGFSQETDTSQTQATPVAPVPATVVEQQAEPAALPVPANRITVTSTPDGAEVYIAGKRVGATPFTRDNPPLGNFTLSVSRAGFVPTTRVIEYSGGAVEYSFALQAVQNQPDPAALQTAAAVREAAAAAARAAEEASYAARQAAAAAAANQTASKETSWSGVILTSVGAGLILCGLFENANVTRNVNANQFSRAENAATVRNITYIAGTVALSIGVPIQIYSSRRK